MFNRALAAGIALILILTALLSFALVRITDGDRVDYHTLLARATPKVDRPLLVTQHRKGVVKEIQVEGHHLKLTCDTSRLIASSKATKEEMEKLTGFLDLFLFKAEKGCYDYRSHIFTAEKGSFEGEKWSGKAGKIEIYLGKEPEDAPIEGGKLMALKEGAHLQSPKGRLTSDLIWISYDQGEVQKVRTNGKTTLCFSNEEMLTTFGTVEINQKNHLITTSGGRVHYTQDKGWFAADEMILTYDDQQTLKNLHLRGSVHLGMHKENLPLRYALADEAIYFPEEDLLTLSASDNNRVLFLDESSDTRLAARQVIAHTKEKSAKAIGGVRSFFNNDELSKIKGITK